MDKKLIRDASKFGIALLCDFKDRIMAYLGAEESCLYNVHWVNNQDESLVNVSDILYIVVDCRNPENVINLKKLVELANANDLFTFIIAKGLNNIDVDVDGMLLVADDILKHYNGIEYLVYNVVKSINDLVLDHNGLVDIPANEARMFFNQSKQLIFASAESRKEDVSRNLIKDLLTKMNTWKVDLERGKSALIDITGNENDISMFEIMGICESIFDELSQDAFVVWGATVDNNLHDVIRVSMWINTND